MLNPSEGKFSEETSPKERRTRQTIEHPDFPKIKNGMQMVKFALDWWNYDEFVYASLLDPSERTKSHVLDAASKYALQHRLAENGFGEHPLDSLSSYLSRLNAQGEIYKVKMRDHLNGEKTQSMYCSNEEGDIIDDFHWKFSKYLNSMTEGQLHNFSLNHQVGRFTQATQQ